VARGRTPVKLLELSAERREAERRRGTEREAAAGETDRKLARMRWQCVLLTFAGVPFYLLSWRLTDPRSAAVWAALALFVSYACPFFRWLHFHVSQSESFD
jgi:hypothetical protein